MDKLREQKLIPLIIILIIIVSFLLGFEIRGVYTDKNTNQNININSISEIENVLKVNINYASKDELKTLDGIGEVKACKILDSRHISPFTSVYDLLSRKLIGETVMDNIKNKVVI